MLRAMNPKIRNYIHFLNILTVLLNDVVVCFYHRIYLCSFNYAVYRHAICTRRLCSNRKALFVPPIAEREVRSTEVYQTPILFIVFQRTESFIVAKNLAADADLSSSSSFSSALVLFNSSQTNFLYIDQKMELRALNVIDRFHKTKCFPDAYWCYKYCGNKIKYTFRSRIVAWVQFNILKEFVFSCKTLFNLHCLRFDGLLPLKWWWVCAVDEWTWIRMRKRSISRLSTLYLCARW